MARRDQPGGKFPNTGSEKTPPGATRKAFQREKPPRDGSRTEADTSEDTTQPAEDWGQRHETGKQIASGGKRTGPKKRQS